MAQPHPATDTYHFDEPQAGQEAREAMDAIDAFEVRLSGGAPARNAVLASGGQKRSSPPSALSGKMTGRDYDLRGQCGQVELEESGAGGEK